MATKAEVAELIAVLAASFPAFKDKLSAFPKADKQRMVHAYHLALEDIDSDLLAQVIKHIVSTATFFPSAGEIRRAAFHLAEVGLGIPSAQDAWAEVSVMIRKGFWETDKGWWEARPPQAEDWSHPLVQRAVEAVGGWVALRTSENTVADRARFLQAFDTYVERYREQERMLPSVRQTVEQLGNGERVPQLAGQVEQVVSGLAEKMRF